MEIKRTTNYDMFKFMEGNRTTDDAHIRRLARSYGDKPHGNKYNPVVVNRHKEIVDGQHTFLALKEMGMPIHYVEHDDAELSDVISMNSINKTWGPIDYARSYAVAGKPAYKLYLDLLERYGMPHRVLAAYISGKIAGGSANESFRMGRFVARDLGEIIIDLDRLRDVGEVYIHYKGGAFALAMYTVMHSPEYDHARLLKKFEEIGHTVPRMSGREDNIRAIERVYNFHMGSESRVRFDYGE